MNESKNRLPGRPISKNKLTPAQKQRAYRERLRVKNEVLEVNASCTFDQFDEMKTRIEKLEQFNALLTRDLYTARQQSEELQSQVWALEMELSKRLKKSNVTKIYKQVDIENL